MARQDTPGTDSPFYGFPAELVAKWCRVSVATASTWKSGRCKPSPTALALFRLYSEERVLTEEFRGFIVRRGQLVPPNGRGFTPGQLETYELVYKIAMTYARPEVEAHLERMNQAKATYLAPEVGSVPSVAPRWIVDPFFDPRAGRRQVLVPDIGSKA